jgi:hypothetical protein
MKSISKFCALAAVLAATATFASADTIIDSNTSDVLYQGSVTASADAPFNAANPFAFISSGLNAATFNPGTGGGAWVGPITGSTYVSNNAGSAPGGGYVAPNGYYTYTTTVTGVLAGTTLSSISLLADDTVAVFLNGASSPFVPAGAVGTDGHCSVNEPNCNAIDTIPESLLLSSGSDTFTFVVEQTGLSGEGLDFALDLVPPVQTTITPEPSTLLLLGTGLIGSAGALFRRMRS